MVEFFVNLKRFDIPRGLGGICPDPSPAAWIRGVVAELVRIGVGAADGYSLVFLLPESLVIPFSEALDKAPAGEIRAIRFGVQTVYREDVGDGGNFGAFTANLPASAARALGSEWAMVGHSEERLDKASILSRLDTIDGSTTSEDAMAGSMIADVVNGLVAEEAVRAARAGMNALVCVGETAEERGEGTLDEVSDRVRTVLNSQLGPLASTWKAIPSPSQLTIGYEPRWAIGPGKTPPDSDYVEFVASHIRRTLERELGFKPPVVYGGGLKRENASEIASVESIAGGLIALTKFTGEIGFTPDGLHGIINAYFGG